MHTPRIRTFDTKEMAADNLASGLAEKYLRPDAKRPLLFLLSGGSALSVIEHLPVIPGASFLTLSVVDERVDPSRATSNLQALKRTRWFRTAVLGGASFIDPLADEQPHSFEMALRQWKEEHKLGLVVALLGMGADGHTAGIFPARDAATFDRLFRGDTWVVAHTVPDAPSYPERITVTLTFLQKEADKVYVFICGQEKRLAWNHLLARDVPLSTLPILGIYGARETEIFTDLRP